MGVNCTQKTKTEKMKTLYNLTKKDCIALTNNYNTDELALLLWDKGKAKSLESGIKKAKKIKKFSIALV